MTVYIRILLKNFLLSVSSISGVRFLHASVISLFAALFSMSKSCCPTMSIFSADLYVILSNREMHTRLDGEMAGNVRRCMYCHEMRSLCWLLALIARGILIQMIRKTILSPQKSRHTFLEKIPLHEQYLRRYSEAHRGNSCPYSRSSSSACFQTEADGNLW